MLSSGVVNSRAELARSLGVSRARVTQLLNLLKLPPAIVNYLAECSDPVVTSYFTERRLRLMTMATDREGVLKWFTTVLSELRTAGGDDGSFGDEPAVKVLADLGSAS